jgi:hypothetical protein
MIEPMKNTGDPVTETIMVIGLVHKPAPKDKDRQDYKRGWQPSSEAAEPALAPREMPLVKKMIYS